MESHHRVPFRVIFETLVLFDPRWVPNSHYLSRRCPWCNGYRRNGYRRRKWTRRHEFKSWTRLIAFHIALIPLGKLRIQLFSLQLWINIKTEWVLQTWWGNKSRRRKTLNSNLLNSASKLTLCHILPERRGWINRITCLGQSRPGSNENEGVLFNP